MPLGDCGGEEDVDLATLPRHNSSADSGKLNGCVLSTGVVSVGDYNPLSTLSTYRLSSHERQRSSLGLRVGIWLGIRALGAVMFGLRGPVPHGHVLRYQSSHHRYCTFTCL